MTKTPSKTRLPVMTEEGRAPRRAGQDWPAAFGSSAGPAFHFGVSTQPTRR